ncbi:glycosyltransferase [Silvibacterium sp.]|uniref:glycosyltransferase n=1 Tax=Silvibacterium sp. TaxID=1964179 RepID=UPI0039E43184
MSRFLFIVPPLTGHINPTVAVGAELASRGHEVAWTGPAFALAKLLPEGAILFPADEGFSASDMQRIAEIGRGLRGAEAFRFLWKDFILPLGRAMLPAVERAVYAFQPHTLIVDQQALAGAGLARERNLCWATSATTSSDLVDPFETFPLFADWLRDELISFQQGLGISHESASVGDLRFSEHLVLAFSTKELVGDTNTFPKEWLFVGPAIEKRPGAATFPWNWLDPARRHVLVTLGTISGAIGHTFFANAIAAAQQMHEHIQMIVIAPDGVVQAVPPNVIVLPSVPQLELLPHIDVVVCHAGHNTVCETLAHGIPLVVAPIRDDQPIIAQQVTNSGAGIRMKFGRAKIEDFVNALTAVLTDDSYRESARVIQDSFRNAGGSAKAAAALEDLALRSSLSMAIAG